MALNLNLWTALALFAVGQGLFLSLVLFFHKRGPLLANRILALLILVFTLRLAEFLGYWINLFRVVPHLSFTTVSFQFLFGVLLYLYARTLTAATPSLVRTDWLHLIPFTLQLSELVPFYLRDSAFKIQVLERVIYTDNPVFSPRFFVVEGLQDLHMLIYTILTIGLIRRYREKRKRGNGAIQAIQLRWLQNLAIGFGFFILLDIVHLIELGIYGYEHIEVVDSFLLFVSALLIHVLGYSALRQPEVISGMLKARAGEKYEKSSLTPQKADAYQQKLLTAMTGDKLFLDPALNLVKLSEALAISSYHLSQIINERLNQNFFDFINSYRVEEAKQLLGTPDQERFTILSIAYDVGFNNKASFNTAFKKHTGMTPSKFRNSVRKPVKKVKSGQN